MLLGFCLFLVFLLIGLSPLTRKRKNDPKISEEVQNLFWAKKSIAVWRQPYRFPERNLISENLQEDFPNNLISSEPTEFSQFGTEPNDKTVMKLTEHFTLEELIASNKAKVLGLDNKPCYTEIQNLLNLCVNVLEPLRVAWGKPIRVNSGYRSEAVNKAVGGVVNSQHKLGQAADITSWSMSPSENEQLFKLCKQLNLPYDQLIDEKGYSWLHISYGPKNRHQVLHLK